MTTTIDLDANTALVLVDVQKAFDDAEFWGVRNNPDCESNIAALLTEWRRNQRPIVFVRHDSDNPDSPLHPDQPGHEFKDEITGSPDLLVSKSVNSSFHGSPDLNDWLCNNKIGSIVICGITTNHCCETTARVGGNLGYHVYFALDATHTFDRTGPLGDQLSADELTKVTGVNLHGEFATVVSTNQLVSVSDISGAGS